jgi:hypothetical protein
MLTPKKLLQRAVKYLTARWSLERVVKCYFTARQSRENRHVKKKRVRQPCYLSYLNVCCNIIEEDDNV